MNRNKLARSHIVIVGGGAGGLELAARLARYHQAKITLVDATLTHLWKPLLHEVAAGTINSHDDELNYFVYAYKHQFNFEYGFMEALDRKNKLIWLAAITDETQGIVIPKRKIHYDILVLAIGSTSNDMNIPGVKQHCFFLDNLQQAEFFHQQLLNRWLGYQHTMKTSEKKFQIVIVGGGATGIELAAEIREMSQQISEYGLDKMYQGSKMGIVIIESSPRLISALPERISAALRRELQKMNIEVFTNEYVTTVTKHAVTTKSGLFIPSSLTVWAAGIKAPEILKNFGLDLNQRNQILVKPNLQSTVDEAIFAIGDCACCMLPNSDKPVPPRAQAAHQEAKLLAKSLIRKLQHKSLLNYQYHDYGSLVTLSHNVVGNLMGKFIGSIMLEGLLARIVYLSLYRSHLLSLHGFWRMSFLTITNFLNRRVKPRLKLH